MKTKYEKYLTVWSLYIWLYYWPWLIGCDINVVMTELYIRVNTLFQWRAEINWESLCKIEIQHEPHLQLDVLQKKTTVVKYCRIVSHLCRHLNQFISIFCKTFQATIMKYIPKAGNLIKAINIISRSLLTDDFSCVTFFLNIGIKFDCPCFGDAIINVNRNLMFRICARFK